MVAPDAMPASLPLARLLGHAADTLQAVRAGASLTAALVRTPDAARPGTQALAFHALRWLGGAIAVRARLAP
jgi:16S rRNA (cytosine967-C5)-methyltransferase